MGRVYAAEHVLLRKKVAVKLLRAERAHVPEVAARFEREAMASANIEHPNIAAASDFGRLSDGSVYLVLEYVQGKSLRNELSDGPLSVARSLHITRQIASALAAAEERGIVHRDLKPENVMLVEKLGDADFVKVLDFGIARVPMAEKDDSALTQVGVVFGTPEYMAPEQALGQRVDSRADLYALGVMLFEMIAGERPHGELKSPAVKLAEAPVRLSARAPRALISEALDELVLKLLQPDLRKRFQHAAEAVAAIDAVAAELASKKPDGAVGGGSVGGGRTATSETSSAGARVPRAGLPTFLPGDPLPSFDLPSETELPAPVDPPTVLRAPKVELSSAPVAWRVAGSTPPPEEPVEAIAQEAQAAIEAPVSAIGSEAAQSPSPAAASVGPPRATPSGLSALYRSACHFIDARRDQLPPFIRRRVKRVPAGTLLGACAVFGATLGVSGVLLMRVLTTPAAPVVTSAPAAPGPGDDLVIEPLSSAPSPASATPPAVEKAPEGPESLVQLAKARLGEKQEGEAIELLGRAIAQDPALAGDENVHGTLLTVLRSKTPSTVDAAFAFLQGPMGKDGADLIYDAAFAPELTSKTRTRALTWLRTKDFDRVSTPALYSAVKLRFAASCQQKFQLLKLVENQGGKRALAYLQELSKKTSCKAADCYPCLEKDGRLKETISAIERRLAQQPAP